MAACYEAYERRTAPNLASISREDPRVKAHALFAPMRLTPSPPPAHIPGSQIPRLRRPSTKIRAVMSASGPAKRKRRSIKSAEMVLDSDEEMPDEGAAASGKGGEGSQPSSDVEILEVRGVKRARVEAKGKGKEVAPPAGGKGKEVAPPAGGKGKATRTTAQPAPKTKPAAAAKAATATKGAAAAKTAAAAAKVAGGTKAAASRPEGSNGEAAPPSTSSDEGEVPYRTDLPVSATGVN